MIIKSANLGVHPLQHLHHRSITHLGNVTRSTIVLILGNGSIQPLLVKVPKIYVNIDLYRWMYLSFIHNSNTGRICQLLALYLAAVFGLYIATICDYHASESFILVVGFRCLPAWGWVSNWLRQVPFYNASGSFCFQPYGTKSSWVSCYPTDLCMLKFSGGVISLQYVFRVHAIAPVLLSKMPWTWVCLSDLPSWILTLIYSSVLFNRDTGLSLYCRKHC